MKNIKNKLKKKQPLQKSLQS